MLRPFNTTFAPLPLVHFDALEERVLYSTYEIRDVLGRHAMAYDMNNAGEIVGWLATKNGDGHAFVWSPNRASKTSARWEERRV